jgi:hypothetical protein
MAETSHPQVGEFVGERPRSAGARWLIAIVAVLAIMILFGAWAFLAERAKVDVRADRAQIQTPR